MMERPDNNMIHQSWKRLRVWLREPGWRQRLVLEAAALTGIGLAILAELTHIAGSHWLLLFFYDGDSLTLPILQQSLARHEPIQWVFSSQLNAFPEGLLYVLTAAFTASVKVTLLLGAVVNLLLFYVLVRWLLVVATNLRLWQRQLYAMVTMFGLVAYMLLEVPSGAMIGQNFATYFLFTTYYSGALLVGMLSLLLLVWQLKVKRTIYDWKYKALLATYLVIVAATITSNPLYVIQFSAPLIAAVLLLAVLRYISLSKTAILVGLQLLPVVAGMLLRPLFKDFVGQPLTSHLTNIFSMQSWRASAYNLLDMMAPYGASAGVTLRIWITLLVYFGFLLGMLVYLNRQHKSQVSRIAPYRLLIVLFIVLQPIITAILLSVGAGVAQRYFIVSVILPLLMIVFFASSRHEKVFRKWCLRLAPVLVLTFFAVILLGHSQLGQLTARPYPGAQCLARALQYRPATGVADYTLARPLDVYGVQGQRVLQIFGGIGVFPWLNNIASYYGKSYSFIVAQRTANRVVSINQRSDVDSEAIRSLNSIAPPKRIYVCPNFDVYVYEPGTASYRALNSYMSKSLQYAKQARANGKIGEYNGYYFK